MQHRSRARGTNQSVVDQKHERKSSHRAVFQNNGNLDTDNFSLMLSTYSYM